VAIKMLIGVLPPVTISFLRFGIPIVFLLVALRWREGSVGMPRRDLTTVLLLGALGFGLYQVLWATALRTMPAGESALIGGHARADCLVASVAGTDLTREKDGIALGSAWSWSSVPDGRSPSTMAWSARR
jgi:hypothetical protein